jgi:hypothetical protein
MAKIPVEAHETIFKRWEHGETLAAIAKDHGVSGPAIRYIVKKMEEAKGGSSRPSKPKADPAADVGDGDAKPAKPAKRDDEPGPDDYPDIPEPETLASDIPLVDLAERDEAPVTPSIRPALPDEEDLSPEAQSFQAAQKAFSSGGHRSGRGNPKAERLEEIEIVAWTEDGEDVIDTVQSRDLALTRVKEMHRQALNQGTDVYLKLRSTSSRASDD